jgi:hypothetical protein
MVSVTRVARTTQCAPAHAQRIIAITDAGDQGLIALLACQCKSEFWPPEHFKFHQQPLILPEQVVALFGNKVDGAKTQIFGYLIAIDNMRPRASRSSASTAAFSVASRSFI